MIASPPAKHIVAQRHRSHRHDIVVEQVFQARPAAVSRMVKWFVKVDIDSFGRGTRRRSCAVLSLCARCDFLTGLIGEFSTADGYVGLTAAFILYLVPTVSDIVLSK